MPPFFVLSHDNRSVYSSFPLVARISIVLASVGLPLFTDRKDNPRQEWYGMNGTVESTGVGGFVFWRNAKWRQIRKLMKKKLWIRVSPNPPYF